MDSPSDKMLELDFDAPAETPTARRLISLLGTRLGFSLRQRTTIALSLTTLLRLLPHGPQRHRLEAYLRRGEFPTLQLRLRPAAPDLIAAAATALEPPWKESPGDSGRLMAEWPLPGPEPLQDLPAMDDDAALAQDEEDLAAMLAELQDREQQARTLTRELEETNQGVLILHSDLQQKASELQALNAALKKRIHQHQQTEAELRDTTRELERSNRELEQFAYIASHDLQSPLRAITGFLNLLSHRYQGKIDPEADEFITFAVQGAARMQQLINDILAYSRVGTRGDSPTPVDCRAVLEQVLLNLREKIETSRTVITSDPLPVINGDASQLVQLFQNLIDNGLKYRRPAVPPRIHLAVEQRDSEWLFILRDNGIGLEPQYAERIFLIFQRLHSAEEYAGTGIGLAICRKIVERHGGRIWVESQPGQGTSFFFTLPRA